LNKVLRHILVVALLPVLLFTACNYSQDCGKLAVKAVQKTKLTTFGHPAGMYFLNKDTGFVLDEQRYLHKTIDGGLSWTDSLLKIDYTLTSFKMNSHGIAYFAGGGYLWKSIDSCKSFMPVVFKFNYKLSNISNIELIGSDTCFITARCDDHNLNFIIRTTDKGETWKLCILPFEVNDISQANAYYGVASGCTNIVLITHDGWKTYSQLTVPDMPLAISIPPENSICISCRSKILFSKDDGRHWLSTKKFVAWELMGKEHTLPVSMVSSLNNKANEYIFFYETKLFKINQEHKLSAYSLESTFWFGCYQVIDSTLIYYIDDKVPFTKIQL
jgi:hypothetical protein